MNFFNHRVFLTPSPERKSASHSGVLSGKNHYGFNLDEELTEKETAVDLGKKPKLNNYMRYCARRKTQLLLC